MSLTYPVISETMHNSKHGHGARISTWCWHKHLPRHGAAHHHTPHHHAVSTAHHASAAHAHHVPTCAVATPHSVGTTATAPAPGPAGFPFTSKALISFTLCCYLSCATAKSQYRAVHFNIMLPPFKQPPSLFSGYKGLIQGSIRFNPCLW